MPPLENVLVVSAILFCIGVMGVLTRRNAILILMAVELMLAAVSLNLVAFAVYGRVSFENFTGIIFAFFVIVIAAAEVALALGTMAAMALLAVLIGAAVTTKWVEQSPRDAIEPVPFNAIGDVLFTAFVVPFIVIGILLSVALDGAILLATPEEEEV